MNPTGAGADPAASPAGAPPQRLAESAAPPPGPIRPFLMRFFKLKWRLANNHLLTLRKHFYVHLAVALGVLVMLVGGGTTVFSLIFNFLMQDAQEPFGAPLMDHLIKMVLLAFFSMLIFSNLIIMLTTTYISREVEFLMAQPIDHRRLFMAKLGESIVYSSWAFIILAFPMFTALGQSRQLAWYFYPGMAVLIVPYLLIPATVGAALAVVLTYLLPPRKMIRLALVLALLGVLMAVVMQRVYGIRQMIASDTMDLARMMRMMSMGDFVALPSGWLGRALQGLQQNDWTEVASHGLALWTTALMGLTVCDWLAGPLYYRGWCRARGSGAPERRGGLGLYGWLDRALRGFSPATRAMAAKDLAVFWRDPAQWSQLAVLFGLLFIYIINLRSAAHMSNLAIFQAFWQSLVSLFNIGATTFVLSILTTRFVYPLLSLEGKQQWVIGLAPIGRTRIIWIKLAVCVSASLVLTVPLALLSSLMLRTGPMLMGLGLLTVGVVSLGLNSLALGLGAIMPNFQEDNPSRIANGVGGTLNVVISMAYIGATLALEAPLVHAHATGGGWSPGVLAAAAAWVLLQVGMITVPLALGLRHWRRMEF